MISVLLLNGCDNTRVSVEEQFKALLALYEVNNYDVELQDLSKIRKELSAFSIDSDSNITRINLNEFGEITALPGSLLVKLPHLEYLYAENNKIEELPKEIGHLKKLRYIILRGNKLKELPVEICDIDSLRSLELSNNDLERLPDSLGKLTGLDGVLSFYNNKLKTIPASISRLNGVTELDLSFNPLDSLPASISTMNLKRVSLIKCNIRDLSTFTSPFPHLKNLYLDGNDSISLNSIDKYSSLEFLSIDKCKLAKFPENLVSKSLEVLSIQYNSVPEIPSAINQIKKLKRVYLNDNELTDIPDALLKKKTITGGFYTGIYVGNNKLCSISKEKQEWLDYHGRSYSNPGKEPGTADWRATQRCK